MKILPKLAAYRAVNFNARSKESKKADDIQRKTRAEFPMISPSYVEKFYFSAKSGSKNRQRTREINRHLWDSLLLGRSMAGSLKGMSVLGHNVDPVFDIEMLKSLKSGCCDESVDATLAVLFANGYFNASAAQLLCEIDFIDINTQKEVFKTQNSIKHCFVTAGFDKDDSKEDFSYPSFADFPAEISSDISFEEFEKTFGMKFLQDDAKDSGQNFVIDAWLGFADYRGAAVARYKQAFFDEIEEFKNNSLIRFIDRMQEEAGEDACFDNLENYKMVISFKFKNLKPKTEQEKRIIGLAVKKAYPQLVLEKVLNSGNIDINV